VLAARTLSIESSTCSASLDCEPKRQRICGGRILSGDSQLWIVVHESKSVAGIRRIPVARELAPWLTRGNGGMLNAVDTYMFQTSTGKAPHRNCIGKVVARVAKRAGVACSPHRLRRTLGYDLLNHGGSLMMVSRILGHSSTQVTEAAYAALLDSTLAREFMAASG
jgi:integrase